VTIPASVTTIEHNAFNTNQLASVTIPAAVTSIEYDAFYGNSLTLTVVLFEGNYNAGFVIDAFINNPLLETINADTGTTGWEGIGFDNGTQPVPVTLIVPPPPPPPAPPAPVITNVKPTANAGRDITITSADDWVSLQLDGSASRDEEGAIEKYLWFEVRDTTGYFIASGVFPRITLENGKTYRLRLQVKDSANSSDDHYFWVTLNKRAVPDVPQQSLSKITRSNGTATDSSISIGASSDGGETTDTTFTVDDEVTLTAKIYPDSDDVGEEGELYVVMRSTVDGKKTFTALNQDGNWEPWNARLKSLPAAKIFASLQEVEDVFIHSGKITAGDRQFYVGYSLYTEYGKPVITTSLSPYIIAVTE